MKAAFEIAIKPVLPGDGDRNFDDLGSDHERASQIPNGAFRAVCATCSTISAAVWIAAPVS